MPLRRVDVRAEHDPVAITIERLAKSGIALVRRIEDQIEHDQPRARLEKPIEQERPDFARPRERPLRHQLQGAIVRKLFRQKRRQLERALIDAEKDKIRTRRRLPAFALEKILEVLLLPPDRGEKGNVREKMDQR